MAWIATRNMIDDTTGREFTVQIGAPERAPRGEWQCAVSIDDEPIVYGRGYDGVQALMLAFEKCRLILSARRCSWAGNPAGEHGFPATVPTYFGPGFQERMTRILSDEIAAEAVRLSNRSGNSGAS